MPELSTGRPQKQAIQYWLGYIHEDTWKEASCSGLLLKNALQKQHYLNLNIANKSSHTEGP